jgi:hypothetical protein
MSCGQLFVGDVKESRGRKWLVVGIETERHVSATKKFENFQSLLQPHILEEIHLCTSTFTMGKTAPPKKKGGTYLISLLYS